MDTIGWQACPICKGSGQVYGYTTMQACSVCKGEKIISVVTGLPPSGDRVRRDFDINDLRKPSSGDFRDDPVIEK